MQQKTWKGWRGVLAHLALLIGVLASMATNMAEDEKDPKDAEEDVIPTCTEDAECTEGAPHCLQSYSLCVECLDHDHCGAQQRCHDHRCIFSCEDASQCEGELICREGLCVSCENDTECGDPRLYCYVGRERSACRPLCARSADCTGPGFDAGTVCRGGRCVEVVCQSPQECLLDEELCNNGSGTCESIVQTQ